MLTLHVVAEKTKSFLKFAAVGVVGLLIFLWLFQLGIKVKESLFPTPPPPPTVRFGKLPSIQFPKKETPNYTYTIDTLSGELPSFPLILPVHTIASAEPTLLSLQKASQEASTLGFTSSSKQVSEWRYQWHDEMTPPRTLTLDILYKTFTVSSSLDDLTFLIDQKVLKSNEELIEKAKNFISSLSSFPVDIDPSKNKFRFYKIENNQLTAVEKESEKKVTEIYFSQNPVNDLPIFYPDPQYAPMRFLFSGTGEIINADYFYYTIQEDNSTYPIKSSQEAFADLEKGKAYIPNALPTDTKNVKIKNVLLGYYMGKDRSDFLLPIVVFEGENGFFAYVSALKSEWELPITNP